MSTPGTTPTDPTPDAPPATFPPATGTATAVQTPPVESTSEGSLGDGAEAQPGWVTRHTTTLITLMVAVIVAAIAIAGLVLYRNKVEQRNSDTEAAFSANVAQQGASLETIQCSGDTCAAVINGQAYTVLVQKDAQGHQHFGVAAYSGK